MSIIGHKVRRSVIFLNEKGEYCAKDESGVWHRVSDDDTMLSTFAKAGIQPAYPDTQAPPPDGVQRIAAELEALKTTVKSFQASTPTVDDLNRVVGELKSLARQVGSLRVILGDDPQLEELIKSLQDLTKVVPELHKQIGDVKTSVNTSAEALKNDVNDLGDRVNAYDGSLQDLNTRFERFEKGPAAAVPPQPVTPPTGAGTAPRRSLMSRLVMGGAIAAAVALVVVAVTAGSRWSSPSGMITSLTPASSVAESRIAEIAGATFDQRVKPLERDVERLQGKTNDLANGVAALDTKVVKVETSVMAGIKDVLDRLDKSGPNTPVASSVEAKRLAQLKAECLPEASASVNVKDGADGLSDEAFQQYLRGCRAAKEQTMRQAQGSIAPLSGPQVAARQPDAESEGAEGDDPEALDGDAEGDVAVTGQYDRRTKAAMNNPLVAQAGYRGSGLDFGRPGIGRGRHHGGPRCPGGSKWSGEYGKCIGTHFHHIPVSPERQAELATCRNIETHMVMRGNKLVEQQRGVACVGRRSY